MNGHEILEIVLKTSDELSRDYGDWEGDICDFVSASVAVSDSLSSNDVRDLHKEMQGSSFITKESEIVFYSTRGRPHIFVKPLEKKQ